MTFYILYVKQDDACGALPPGRRRAQPVAGGRMKRLTSCAAQPRRALGECRSPFGAPL